jgi:hypothetical protein
MKYSIFWVTICMAVSCCTSYAAAQEKPDFSYTGIPDLYVELSEIHLVDINKIKYSVYVGQDFGLSKVTISRNDALIEIAGKCFQDIHFPDLQTLKVSKGVIRESLEAGLTIFNMEFHYFGKKEAALSENVELQDWTLKLLVTDDLSGKLEVEGKARKLSIECEVSITR